MQSYIMRDHRHGCAMVLGNIRNCNVHHVPPDYPHFEKVKIGLQEKYVLHRASRFMLEQAGGDSQPHLVYIRDLRHGMLLTDDDDGLVKLTDVKLTNYNLVSAMWEVAYGAIPDQHQNAYFIRSFTTNRYLAAPHDRNGSCYTLRAPNAPRNSDWMKSFTWSFEPEPHPKELHGFLTSEPHLDLDWFPRINVPLPPNTDTMIVRYHISHVPGFTNDGGTLTDDRKSSAIRELMEIWNRAFDKIGARVKLIPVENKPEANITITTGNDPSITDQGIKDKLAKKAALGVVLGAQDLQQDSVGGGALIIYNTSYNWNFGWDNDDLFARNLSFFRSLVHELGHCFGLNHSEFDTSIMYDTISSKSEIDRGQGGQLELNWYDLAHLRARYRKGIADPRDSADQCARFYQGRQGSAPMSFW